MIHDPKKRKANLRKHKVDLADCYEAFDAPMLSRVDGREDYGEERLVSLRLVKGKIVVLVWVDDQDEPRLISCRKAEPHEEEAYYREFGQI